MRKLLRFIVRFAWLWGELILAAGDFLRQSWRHAGMPPLSERTRWAQVWSRRALRILAVELNCEGSPPPTGLLVSNHLSYLDILVFASLSPAVFVANSGIRSWPVFGWFARMAGTVFIERARRGDVAPTGREIARLLAGGNRVVLFPEGTSSNGRQVLTFKSSLFEPVVGARHRVFAAGLRYALTEGSVENDLCFWGDMIFFPHLLKLLTCGKVRAWIRFAEVLEPAADRKALARQLHAEVVRLQRERSG